MENVSASWQEVLKKWKFDWQSPEEILPSGNGLCLDAGCGPLPYQSLIEAKGYRWVGLDISPQKDPHFVQASADQLPFADESFNAVVSWGVMTYLKDPNQGFREVWRVLKPGGVFCGVISYLEPGHGGNYFGYTKEAIEMLAAKNQFQLKKIEAEINGFTMMLWYYFWMLHIPGKVFLAQFFSALLLLPALWTLWFISRFKQKFGGGKGYRTYWLKEQAPFAYAGRIMFLVVK
jgi:SAM-dependent methyltransferase